MSRVTLRNAVKVTLAVLFLPLVVFLLLVVGIGTRRKQVILEGAAYVAVFFVATTIPESSVLSTAAAFAALGVMAASAVRSYMLRDLWLPARTGRMQHVSPAGREVPVYVAPAQQPAPQRSSDDLTDALSWVTANAKQNKRRLPADTYVTLLETCQTLDAVIDTERRQPSADARFEYELGAVVREYLPSVLQGYLAIPPSMVDDRQPNGKTPNEELVEQLELLSGHADALHSNRHSRTSAELTSTGNFLRERFGHHRREKFDFGIE